MARPPVHIWHEGNLIKIGHWRGKGVPPEPLAANVVAFMAAHMEYNHVQFLRGRERQLAGRRVRTVRKRLWQFDADNLFVCGAGYIDWAIEKLTNLGYEPRYKRIAPKRPRPDWAEFDMERVLSKYAFRPGQRECFDAMVGRIKLGLGGVVDASVGFGKTDLFAPIALGFPNAWIVVGVRGLTNVAKTARHLRAYLPSVGVVTGGKDESGHRVTVYSMDSFEKFQGDADIALFDEAHQIVAPKYVAGLMSRLNQVVPIALSATTNARSDGADARLEAYFGPTIFYMPYTEAQRLGLVVPIEVVVHHVPTGRNPIALLEDDTARKRHGIWRNKVRNRLIADAANGLDDDKQTLILVATVDHLAHLRYYLPHYEAVWAESSNAAAEVAWRKGLWPDYEKMTPARRERLYEDFRAGKIRKAIATIWGEGASFDGLSDLIWAKGGSSAIAATQGPGRVSRIDPKTGKAVGVVHDFDDAFDSGLHAQFQTRVTCYRKNGWTIVSAEEPAAP